jgi:DNA-binding HxlR family transcriptional regulator
MEERKFLWSTEALGIKRSDTAQQAPARTTVDPAAERAVLHWGSQILRAVGAAGASLTTSALFGQLEADAGPRFDLQELTLALRELEQRGMIRRDGAAYELTDAGRAMS